jgi:hypothetical protein
LESPETRLERRLRVERLRELERYARELVEKQGTGGLRSKLIEYAVRKWMVHTKTAQNYADTIITRLEAEKT